MEKFLEKLQAQPQWLIILIGIILVSLIGVVDYIVVINISLAILYLFPIILATWLLGRRVGIIFSLLSAVFWFFAELYARQQVKVVMVEWNAIVIFVFFSTITYLLGELKQAYEREKLLARADGLTGICNRRYFLELLDAEVQRFQRYQHPFTVAYLDVDNFKTVNDTLGHSCGDQLLLLIAHVLKLHTRQTDLVARLGGDEFALVLPETNFEAGQLVLQRIQQQLLKATSLESFPVGFSIGAITFNHLPESVDKILEEVDLVMYQVKQTGKNNINHISYNTDLNGINCP